MIDEEFNEILRDTKLFAPLKYGTRYTLTLCDTAVFYPLCVVTLIMYGGCWVLYMQCGSWCPFWFGNLLVTCIEAACVSLPRGAVDWSAVCDCGISWSYSPKFFFIVLYVLNSIEKWKPNSPFHELVCYSEGILKSEAYQVMNLSNNMRLSKTANSLKVHSIYLLLHIRHVRNPVVFTFFSRFSHANSTDVVWQFTLGICVVRLKTLIYSIHAIDSVQYTSKI